MRSCGNCGHSLINSASDADCTSDTCERRRLVERIEVLERALRETADKLDRFVNAGDDINDFAAAAREFAAANDVIARARATLEDK